MITLCCRPKDKIALPTLNIAVEVVKIERGLVHLGIESPPDVPVFREAATPLAIEARQEGHPRGEGGQARFMRQLSARLGEAVLAMGVTRLQLDVGLLAAAKAALTRIQEEVQLLRAGVEGQREDPPITPASAVPSAPRALLVEDDCNQRELLAGFLRHSGMKVDTAGDGSDALDYLSSHGKPDVILLDMGLPHVDGPTTVRQIRRNPAFAGIKIFAVTGRQPNEFDLECGPQGIDRWFHKPLDPAALLHDLAEELDGSRCL
jgi:CheY-like chemotaxis protein/sRNA-binding carbon storage regulator CsrA